jgi:hypothetical protein
MEGSGFNAGSQARAVIVGLSGRGRVAAEIATADRSVEGRRPRRP